MKLSGMLLLLFCGGGTGFYLSRQIRSQIRIWSVLIALLEDCMIYIRYQHLPLPELFALLKEKQAYQNLDFLQKLSFTPELSPETLWNQALEGTRVPPQAREILRNLGAELGRTDLQGQLAVLTLCRTQMQNALEHCRTDCEQKSKLYQALGWLGGAAMAVLFL
ncbi:MAG: stage III sporulation protein AB [Oscillospiraceae bacterium]|nr:stage III sporulation protein AB [Oscillospiraceae bacterium]